MNKIEALEQALAAATPGEWASSWNFIVADDPSGKHADIYLLVYEEGRCDPERCEANAQLIALMKNTLPDLLEAVRVLETIANSEEYHGETVVCDFNSLLNVANHALAKLRGKDQ